MSNVPTGGTKLVTRVLPAGVSHGVDAAETTAVEEP